MERSQRTHIKGKSSDYPDVFVIGKGNGKDGKLEKNSRSACIDETRDGRWRDETCLRLRNRSSVQPRGSESSAPFSKVRLLPTSCRSRPAPMIPEDKEMHALAILETAGSWNWLDASRFQASGKFSGKFKAITPIFLSTLIIESQALGGTLLDQFWDVVSQCHPRLAQNGRSRLLL